MGDENCHKKEMMKKKEKEEKDDPDYIPDPEDFQMPQKIEDASPISFDITIDEKIWKEIEPQSVFYKEKNGWRKHIVFKEGWTDVMADKIWDQTGIPCAFTFKKGKQYTKKNFKYHLRCIGQCKDCPATVEITRKTAPTKFPVELLVKTYDTRKLKHKSKRHASGKARKKAKENCEFKSAKMLQAEQIKKYQSKTPSNMNRSTGPCPLVWSLPVNQKIIQESIYEKLQLANYPGSPLESMEMIAESNPAIRSFGLEPFQVIYWTDDQMKLWREISECKDVHISIDASGGFVKPIELFDGTFTPVIFLYVIVARFLKRVTPLFQMISAAHHTRAIREFINKPLAAGAPIPTVIFSDCSSALLNSISLACCGYSFQTYLSTCFKILNGDKTLALPPTLIKRDRNHLMKNVTSWKCFKNVDWQIKDFYCRTISFCLEVKSKDTLEYIMESLLLICQSACAGPGTECFTRINEIDNYIKTFEEKTEKKKMKLKKEKTTMNNHQMLKIF